MSRIEYTNKQDVIDWLDRYGIEEYIIADDLTVDVKGDVNLSKSDIEYIPVNFGHVTGSFYLSRCYNLKSLLGCPTLVDKMFIANMCNSLIDLTGSPFVVNGSVTFSHSDNIRSFKGNLHYVGMGFTCDRCPNLRTLEHLPKVIKMDLSICECTGLILEAHDSMVGNQQYIEKNDITESLPIQIGEYIEYYDDVNNLDDRKDSIAWLRKVDKEFYNAVLSLLQFRATNTYV